MSDALLKLALAAPTPHDVTRAFDEAEEARTRELLGMFDAQQGNVMYMWTVRELEGRVVAPKLRSELAFADARLAAKHQDTQISVDRAVDAIGHDVGNEAAIAYLRDLLQEPNLVLSNAIERLEQKDDAYAAVSLVSEMRDEYETRFPG